MDVEDLILVSVDGNHVRVLPPERATVGALRARAAGHDVTIRTGGRRHQRGAALAQSLSSQAGGRKESIAT